MPFKRQTLSELREQNRSFLQSELDDVGTLLRFSNMGVLADMDAGMAHLHYGYLDYIALQTTPFTATDEHLAGWGAMKKVFRKPANAAICNDYQFTGTESVIIPAGTILNRGDGYQYKTLYDVRIAQDGTAKALITAILPDISDDATGGGSAGYADAGTVLTLDQSIAGVDVQGKAVTPIIGGADIENEDDFRSRILLAYQGLLSGGSDDDYKLWALSVPGVTRVWIRRRAMGAGTVGIYIMCDNNGKGGFPKGTDGFSKLENYGTSATGDQARVADYIYPLQPVTALVWVCSPIQRKIDIIINGISYVSRDVTNAIAAAIDNVFFESGNPDGTGKVLISELQYAIADVPGTAGFVITNPTSNIKLGIGELPLRGEVIYT